MRIALPKFSHLVTTRSHRPIRQSCEQYVSKMALIENETLDYARHLHINQSKYLLYYDLRPESSLNFLSASASSEADTRNASLPTFS